MTLCSVPRPLGGGRELAVDTDTPFIFPPGSGRPQPPLPAPSLQLCKSVSGFDQDVQAGPGINSLLSLHREGDALASMSQFSLSPN